MERSGTGRVYGRGAADNKGLIVAHAYALVALKQAGVTLGGTLVLAASVDEEIGGLLGTKFLLEGGYIQPDWAVVEGSTYHIWQVMGGALHMQVTTTGKPAHASQPHQGVDAVEAMAHIIQSLYQLRDQLRERRSRYASIGSATLVVGTISGGTKVNVIPDKCTITIDRRILPEEDPEDAVSEVRQAVAEGAAKGPRGARAGTRVLVLASPMGPIPSDSPLIEAIQRRGEQVLGERPDLAALHGFTDGRHYWERGIPIANYGGGGRYIWESNAHRGDENQAVDDMVNTAKVMALVAMDLLGPA